jgi:hypothetical protein
VFERVIVAGLSEENRFIGGKSSNIEGARAVSRDVVLSSGAPHPTKSPMAKAAALSRKMPRPVMARETVKGLNEGTDLNT